MARRRRRFIGMGNRDRWMRREELPFLGQPGRCCFCGAVLEGRRTAWCGDGCIQEFKRRSNGWYFRRAVWERDHGRCEMCGAVQTDKNWRRGWEVDHVVGIADGGDPWAMDNLRTLCVECHKGVTATRNRRRAAERRAAKTV